EKSGAQLFGGHFIGRLAAHFGLVGNQGLKGLSVVVSEISAIDLDELARLNISDKGAQAIPAPVQAPQPQPPAPQPHTMSERIDMLEEETLHTMYQTPLDTAYGCVWTLSIYSYTVPANSPSTMTIDTTSGEAGMKSGRTVTLTAEDMHKKNDATILKTFGGNEATKKTKKNLLKQQYGNFKAEGSETLE
nr:hypothetical protein [Tanacetum cinerariifolium]